MMANRLIPCITNNTNNIGIQGAAGFGVGVYPGALPSGWSTLTGTNDPTNDNYGNYQYSDTSICCWVPAFCYRIGSPASPFYATYGANAVDILPIHVFSSRGAAEASGYAIHRAFINGGLIKRGFMADKYQASKNPDALIASSIKNGNPLSSASTHNPFSSVGAANFYYGAIDAIKTRGSQFHCMSRFENAALALLSLAHGQAATSTINCAWYLTNKNYPKGNNNNAFKDADDTTVVWEHDGFVGNNSGKTGSAGYGGGVGNIFAKSTHNGQNCGIADLNGNMWEINIGFTRPGANATDSAGQDDASAFYVLKESIDINVLTSGWSSNASGNEAFGTVDHLATLYDAITLNHISATLVTSRFGNSTNAVLSNAVTGDGYRQTGLGIYTELGHSAGGTSLFGIDALYERHIANLCSISGGAWKGTANAGVWSLDLYNHRRASSNTVGVRGAAYV
jgi:hypothetical protein